VRFIQSNFQEATVTTSLEKPTLRDLEPYLAEYRVSSTWKAAGQVVSTLLLLIASWAMMYLALSVSYWLSLLLVLPTSLLLVRTFILQHDCGHRSLFRSKRTNDIVGSLLGILTLTPYHCWRRKHAIHHANSGDLDRRGRGQGEIRVMTVEEYRAADWKTRLKYRMYRHPFVLFCIGPVFEFIVSQRFPTIVPKNWKRERRSIHLTNLAAVALLVAMCWLLGTKQFLMIHIPVMVVAGQIGVWLFYVQHQYEEAFYQRADDWDYVQAAMAGSSHYRLPKVLQWFTASIGLHHIHHLDSRIPNYHLQQCHDEQPGLRAAKELTLGESLRCVNFKLWDEQRGKMVGFRDAAQSSPVPVLRGAKTVPLRDVPLMQTPRMLVASSGRSEGGETR
jgi:omega-6 fatty acid desaturase (delta-12 desaturase)